MIHGIRCVCAACGHVYDSGPQFLRHRCPQCMGRLIPLRHVQAPAGRKLSPAGQYPFVGFASACVRVSKGLGGDVTEP